ncbi:helix-turn-helix domain-containing protein [Jeotgalibacillus terrae]|uniref:Helix-turn-helix domain-containing protein n=1 Tax=Jeotgalibacillus terrae TaxID=587735 RepID=A0ABW5ZE94_9BACL|nr:helix-turn-helix domain-containing protein [Jeotgalibacillus terrae]MBM7580509.1 arginine utilization regulatory protein [Jeotgalibacillus terrae]
MHSIQHSAFIQAMIDMIDRGIHVVDENGRTIFYNRKMREMEGMDNIDLLDRRLLDVFQFHPDEQSTLLQALTLKEPILNVQQSYFNAKGHEITAMNDTYPIIVEDMVLGAIEVSREVAPVDQDISPHKKLSSFDHWAGTSPLIRQMISEGKRAAASDEFLLLCGEAGTGKELLAQSIHLERGLHESSFIGIDFRSASAERSEHFIENLQSSSKKTFFMGHAEFLAIELQQTLAKKLLSEKHRPREERNHFILTIGQDPIDAIQSGRLLKELYYVMSERTVFVPALRERKEDISELVQYFIGEFNNRFQTAVSEAHDEVITLFHKYDWPGNVRELEHVLEASMLALGSEDQVSYSHLPHYFRLKFDDPASSMPALDGSAFMVKEGKASQTLDSFLHEAESYYIQKSLQYHEFNITKTADALGMSRQNLQYRMKKHGLKVKG